MSKRRIRRDLHKRVTASGYQQIAGDLEIRGRLLGPTATSLAAAVGKLSASSTTPVQLAAPTAQGGMRSISLNWSRQYTLTNLSHYELQVSEDDLYWYSLVLDGSGWGGIINEDTDVKGEGFNHPNIPLVMDAGILKGKTLYYRVRQVTLAGLKSTWSESVSAATKPVNDLVLTDSYNRYIEISSHKGIYADDRQGHVIHDIPNAPVSADMLYGGHIMWKEATAALGNIETTYTDVATALGPITSAVSNIDISSYVGGNTNVKGALVLVIHTATLAAAKVAIGTQVAVSSRYCRLYNDTTGASFQRMSQFATYSQVATQIMAPYYSDQVLIPVVFNAGIPYISWYTFTQFIGMANGNATYGTNVYLHLQGILV